MPPFTVLFADPKGPADFEWITRLAPAQSLTLVAPADASPAALAALLPGADAIVTQNVAITGEMLAAASRLKLIQRYGTRPDGIDLAAARAAGVAVATMPLHGCIAVAVTWGYAEAGEMDTAKPHHIVDTPAELGALLHRLP